MTEEKGNRRERKVREIKETLVILNLTQEDV